MLDENTLRPLLEPAEPAVSVYFPLDTTQRDLRAHGAELRNMLGLAQEALTRYGVAADRAAALLAPAQEMAGETSFLEHRAPGLALFLGGGLHTAELPETPAQQVAVGRRFLLRPLLPLLARNRRFFILALSAGNLRLFEATPFSLTERHFAVERSVEHVAAESEMDHSLNSNPVARPRGQGPADVTPFHGTESPEEVRKAQLLEHLRRVGAAVAKELGTDPAPLVLVGEPEVAGHFRKFGQVPQLYEQELHLNPHALPDAELHARVTELLRPLLEGELASVLDQANARLGTAESNVAIRLEEILAAAHDGRVDAVVVASDETLWGRYDHDTRVVHTHGTPGAGDEDLLNEAAVVTLRNGGRAFSLPRAQLPRQSPAIALLRY